MRTFGDILKNFGYHNPAIIYFVSFDYVKGDSWYIDILKNIKVYPAEMYVNPHFARKSDDTWISIERSYGSDFNRDIENKFKVSLSNYDMRAYCSNAEEKSHIVFGRNLHIFADKESLELWLNELKNNIQTKLNDLQEQLHSVNYVSDKINDGCILNNEEKEFHIFAKCVGVKEEIFF